jgi:transposase-like protein
MNPQELFCPNDACRSRGIVGAGNVIRHCQRQQRYKCKVCGRTFTPGKGTAFYRLHKKALFVTVSTLLAFGTPPQAIVAAFGLDERTVYAWLKRAGQQAERVHQALVVAQPRHLRHVQADEIRVRLQKHLVVWMAMALQVPTRLWLGGVLSPQRDKRLIGRLCANVKACALFGPLLLVADGLASYVHAWKQAFRTPVWTGKPGRPVLEAWPVLIGQVVKQRANGGVVGVVQRMVQGTIPQAQALLSTPKINTAYIERLNATFRARLCALVRRGRALVRQSETLSAGMYLVGTVYNFCTYHKSLRREKPDDRRKWQRRTPAMAASITDHGWTVQELMTYRVAPPPLLLPRKPGRKPKQTACPT